MPSPPNLPQASRCGGFSARRTCMCKHGQTGTHTYAHTSPANSLATACHCSFPTAALTIDTMHVHSAYACVYICLQGASLSPHRGAHLPYMDLRHCAIPRSHEHRSTGHLVTHAHMHTCTRVHSACAHPALTSTGAQDTSSHMHTCTN